VTEEEDLFREFHEGDDVPTTVGIAKTGNAQFPIVLIDYSKIAKDLAEAYDRNLVKDAGRPCFRRILLTRIEPDKIHVETETRTVILGFGQEQHHSDVPHWWADCQCREESWVKFKALMDSMGFWVLHLQCPTSAIVFFVEKDTGLVGMRQVRPKADVRTENWT